MSTLRGRAKSKNSPASFSWQAIANMSKNITGQVLDYESFKSEYDANPAIAELVSDFNETSITLKTTNEVETPNVEQKTNQVDSMAKRAAEKVMNR